MDPLTQGLVGAIAAQSVAAIKPASRQLAKAAFIGVVAGMAPDLDVLIRSASDPLLALEFHRQFTHSLLFIPLGGLLCGSLLFLLVGKRWQLSFRQAWLWATLGYGTHGLLDACTSYGTLLLWPLSDQRFSWDTISIIDPLFTLPLLVAVLLAAGKNNRCYVVFAVVWGLSYLSLGFIQHHRAEVLGQRVAQARGHEPSRLEVKPSFSNLLVWKLIYEVDNKLSDEPNEKFYVDALRLGLAKVSVWPGQSIAKLNIQRDLPWLQPQSQQFKDIQRFSWFSQGYIALDPNNSLRVIDMRYSMLPNRIKALWGINLSPKAAANQHVTFTSTPRDNVDDNLKLLWNMVVGKGDQPKASVLP